MNRIAWNLWSLIVEFNEGWTVSRIIARQNLKSHLSIERNSEKQQARFATPELGRAWQLDKFSFMGVNKENKTRLGGEGVEGGDCPPRVCSPASLFERQTSERRLLPHPVTRQEFALKENNGERQRESGTEQANGLSLKAFVKYRGGFPLSKPILQIPRSSRNEKSTAAPGTFNVCRLKRNLKKAFPICC